MPDFKPPWTPQQQYKFTGTLRDQSPLSFYVLADEAGPQITDGWTLITTINRPRNKGFTMVTGYNPAAMDVPVRFDATVNYGKFGPTPASVERDIQKLEWMAGRGKLYTNGSHPAQGDPPLVQVSSFKTGSSTSTNLIPPNFHSDQADDLRWWITDIQYDSSPIREGSGGNRKLQKAVVSLIEVVAAPGAPASTRRRQQGRGADGGFVTVTAKAGQSIAQICIEHGLVKQSVWRDVLKLNEPRLHVHSWIKPLKGGEKVRIANSEFWS